MNQFEGQTIELLKIHANQIDLKLKDLETRISYLIHINHRMALDLTSDNDYDSQATVISAILKFLKLEHPHSERLITEYIAEITTAKVMEDESFGLGIK